ncbi:hypothetical protein ABII15_18245 [Streptomyces sp. HUAS MG91]|uniref:DUF3592 domain-containing protein n=1 Tax=Streptomyces tabacisoli TaxID=3156398 RepID=A0AAU8IVF4_9ACTN
MRGQLAGLAAVGVIAVLLTIGAILLLRRWRGTVLLRREGIHVVGECTGLRVLDGGVTVQFEFQVAGVTHSGESGVLSVTDTVPGQDVHVVYAPGRPSHNDMADCVSDTRSTPLEFIALALLAFFFDAVAVLGAAVVIMQ